MRPVACLMVGIAYGADNINQKIGDILISERVQPYDSVRVSTDIDGNTVLEDKNESKTPGRTIRNQFINFDFPGRKYNIWKGTILSGEKLIDNKQYKKELLERFGGSIKEPTNIVGGEMEGVGLASTLSWEGNENWIIVKGICDWADGNKNEDKKERQELAARNAVDFCERLFKTDLLSQINGIKQIRTSNSQKNLDRVEWKYYIEEMKNLDEIYQYIIPQEN